MAYNSATTTAWAQALASQYNNLRKDVLSQAGEYVTAWGTANALTFTIDAQITAYFDGLPIPFKASASNTGAATGNVNAIGAKDIKLEDGSALVQGDIVSGRLYMLRYDGTNLILIKGGSSGSVLTLIPKPNRPWDWTTNSNGSISDVTARVGQLSFEHRIVANKISFRCQTFTTTGNAKIALYSEDWQTKICDGSVTVTAATTVYTITLSSTVTINPWVYFVLFMADVNTASFTWVQYSRSTSQWLNTLSDSVSGEPILEWTYTVTSGVVPATITLASITSAANCTLAIRLDN